MASLLYKRYPLTVPLFALILALASVLLAALPARAQAPIPPGFDLIVEEPGVQLYKKIYANGNPDFVQVVDLSQGARVTPMHGQITSPGENKGVFGGSDARFLGQTLQKYWSQLARTGGDPFCVTNGQFFYMPESPTRLPFSLKKDGAILTDGYGDDHFAGKTLMLELWPGRADITPLSRETLYGSSAPDIIAGLAEDAPKRIKFSVGRTFTGVGDRDGDGALETVFIFNSLSSKQNEAADVLRSFGAAKVMMLDGGGSTQLICNNRWYVKSERYIPQALGVLSAEGQTPPSPEATAAQADAPISGDDAPSAVDDMTVKSTPTAEDAATPSPAPTVIGAHAGAVVDPTPPAGEGQPPANTLSADVPAQPPAAQELPAQQPQAPAISQEQPAAEVPAQAPASQGQPAPAEASQTPAALAGATASAHEEAPAPQEQQAQDQSPAPAAQEPQAQDPAALQAQPPDISIQAPPAQDPAAAQQQPAPAEAPAASSPALDVLSTDLSVPPALSGQSPPVEQPAAPAEAPPAKAPAPSVDQAAFIAPSAADRTGIDDLLMVPAAILPVAMFLLMTILRLRRQ